MELPRPADTPRYARAPHWAALFGAAFTWPLLFVGGLVTTFRVGMAVPDWPTTFGANMFLYNFWKSPWGVFIEHTHRLYGAAVGLCCIGLAAYFLAAEPRRWLKGMGVLALVAVIVQGVLGGTRVTQNSQVLAAVHGCTGQAFFALMVALCVWTGRRWIEAGAAPRRPDPARLRSRAWVTLALIYAQVVVGAAVRHFGDRPAVVVHILLALAVWAHALALALKVGRLRREIPDLLPSALAMLVVVTFQVALGVGALVLLRPFDGIARAVDPTQALVRTGHQANGALLLASAVVLALRAYRGLAPTARPAADREPEPRALEVVA